MKSAAPSPGWRARPVCVELVGGERAGGDERAAALLEQGRYGELLGLLDGLPDDQAVLWRIRCRAEQGYLRVAADLANAAVGTAAGSADDPALQLWRRFLALNVSGDDASVESFVLGCEALEQAADPPVATLAADLRGRAEALRFIHGGRGARHCTPFVGWLVRAADRYQAAGLARETAAALRRAASFGARGLAADRTTARVLLTRAQAEAERASLPIARAGAQLDLAEFELQAVLDGDSGRPLPELLAEFDAIAQRYQDGGHAFGGALVHWCVARWLLAYGFAEGLEIARATALEFAAADVPRLEQEVWTELSMWHIAHGETAVGRHAQQQVTRLAAAIGLSLSAEVSTMGEAHESLRAADVGQARSLLAGRPGWPIADFGYRLIEVTSAYSVGLCEEARVLAKELVADLTAAGTDQVLGEALLLLATIVRERDFGRCTALLDRAAALARANEAATDEAKYRAHLAWCTALHRGSAGAVPVFDEQVLAGFGQARALLAGQRTLKARGELAMVYEHAGQAALTCSEWDTSTRWLDKAEQVARDAGLAPRLAAILMQQGLALLRLGRSHGTACYDLAAAKLDESRALHERIGLSAFTWQAIFHRALCDIEAARLVAPAERAARHERAAGLLEEASALIDRLRESAESRNPAARQETGMAFSVDKQEFYGQGFQFAWAERHDPEASWRWLERMKGRALQDALSERAAPSETTRRAEPPGFPEIRALLAAEERAADGRRIIVAGYACTPEQTVLFGARADWDAPRTALIPLDHARLRRFVVDTFHSRGGVRAMMELPGGGLPTWHEFAALLAPLADWAEPDDVVYLVPHGILHDLPLHTLPLAGAPLIERNPVCYVPAAAVLRHTLRGVAGRLDGDGTAVFGDARKDLRDARQEAAEVAALLGVRPVVGGNVTRARVLRALASASVVHIAGHGRLAAGDGFISSLALAGYDTLQAADLLGRDCRAGLVVLSGCETGVGEQRPGDEVVGFVRALLLSGTRSILASQWRVDDTSTRELLLGFHCAAAPGSGLPLAQALRQAVSDIRADPGYRHPYHWGGFALTGSWR
jgi:tetratricopeptide (TPR) repeat protein